MLAFGYARVSTEEQGQQGASLEAQRAAIAAECQRRGWTLVGVDEEIGSGADSERPMLAFRLRNMPKHGALIVAKVDRLSRSLSHFAAVCEQARKEEWSIVALDLGVDMTTPAGEMIANVMAAFAQYERRLISERTKAGMAVRKAQGKHMGRPREIHEEAIDYMRRCRGAGEPYVLVAEHLNDMLAVGHTWARPPRATRWTANAVEQTLRRRKAA